MAQGEVLGEYSIKIGVDDPKPMLEKAVRDTQDAKRRSDDVTRQRGPSARELERQYGGMNMGALSSYSARPLAGSMMGRLDSWSQSQREEHAAMLRKQFERPPSALHSERQESIEDLQKRLGYANSAKGKQTLAEEYKLRERLTNAEKLATGEVTKFGLAMSGVGSMLAKTMAPLGAALGVVGFFESRFREQRSNVGLSNPTLAERYERSEREFAATLGKRQESAVETRTRTREAYADAYAGLRRDGKMSDYEKRYLKWAPMWLQEMNQDWFPMSKEVEDASKKYKGLSKGSAYDPRAGQIMSGDDLYLSMASETAKMPMGGGKSENEQAIEKLTEAIKSLDEQLRRIPENGWGKFGGNEQDLIHQKFLLQQEKEKFLPD